MTISYAIPSGITSAWRSQQLVQDKQHVLIVRVRPGHMEHGYFNERRIDNNSPIFPSLIWKGHNVDCWKGRWVPDGPWVTLPQIRSADFTRSFQSLGSGTGGSGSGQTSSVLTTVMDNVEFEEVTGPGGIYHVIKRGWFSPLRGTRVASRPSAWAPNDWTNALNGGYQIELWEGYGDPSDPRCVPLPTARSIGPHKVSCAPDDALIYRTWTGLIETCQMVSSPDGITITARDFGLLLTDSRCMGWNKAKEIRSPVKFNDRKQAQGQIPIATPVKVSNGLVKADFWLGGGMPHADDLMWIELTLPAGYYEDFFLDPVDDGQEMYLSLEMGPGGGFRRTGVPFAEGWVDLGYGNVPGTSIPFIRHWDTMPNLARRWALDGTREIFGYSVPAGSKLRLWVTRLTRLEDGYDTSLNGFHAYKFGTDPNQAPGMLVDATHWILVEDASDVIRMILIWAGFQEWNVEDFGWTLAHEKIYGEDKFFMDIVNDILAQGNFMFWMGPPSDDDRSIGVPFFRHQTATDPAPRGMLQVTGNDLLEDADATWDNSDLPFVMRYRGNVSRNGQTLDQDLIRRYMATYFPPWVGEGYIPIDQSSPPVGRPNRVAGIIRHFTQTLGATSTIGLDSDEECLFACVLAAIQYAIQSYTGTIQIAGYPGFDLQDQVHVLDDGSGIDSRLWLASVESHHKMGPQGSWHMTLGGAFIDSDDMLLIRKDYAAAFAKMHGKKLQSSESVGTGFIPTAP